MAALGAAVSLNKPSKTLGTSRSPFATNALSVSRGRSVGGPQSPQGQKKLAKKDSKNSERFYNPFTNKPPASIAKPDVNPGDLYSTFEELYESIMGKYGDRTVPGAGVNRAPFDAANAKIAAMYRQLEDSFGGDAEAIKQFFKTAADTYEANAGQATSSIQGAYGASNAERMRQLEALGIEESAAVVGDDTVRDQANAVSNIARMLEANQGRNTGYQTSAMTLNEQMKGLARMEGAQRQAAVQQALANAMAEGSAPQTIKGMSTAQALSMARSQMSEQDKMIKGTMPTYGFEDVNSLYRQAEQRFPNNPAMQKAWIRSQEAVR
jgi:hypothetical protein